VAEDRWAHRERANLKDDKAIVTSDYKMKILSCFQRENQKKWFGKRGTTLLGFMVETNPTNPTDADKEKGLKDCFFVMLITDDTLQDDWEVAVGTNIVYRDYLPRRIKKVLFVSDGAGCFRSMMQRSIQPFWKVWRGIEEISYRITLAGDGKSALDGMFGRLNTVLRSQVDCEDSYYNTETMLANTINNSTGLAGTKFAQFAPNRSRQVEVEFTGVNFESVLLTTLDSSRPNTVGRTENTDYG
jgi:hypothetical protein